MKLRLPNQPKSVKKKGYLPVVDRVWQLCQRNSRWLQQGADHLVYRLIDEIVNNYTAVLDQLESRIVQLVIQIFTQPSSHLLESMTHYKRNMLEIRRVLSPQREVVNKLARDPFLVVGEKDQILALAVMVLLPVVIFIWMRRRAWM